VPGTFSNKRLEDSKWALYGRTSWLGKLGIELVAAASWISRTGPEREADRGRGRGAGASSSAAGSSPRRCTSGRIQDVVLIANDVTLLNAAHALRKTRGQDSFLQSAKYADNITRTALAGDPLELYFNQLSLAEKQKLSGTWPIQFARGGRRLAAKLFQLGALRELIGTLDFARVLSLDSTAELSSNALTPFQTRLYEQRGFDKSSCSRSRPGAADAGLFAYLPRRRGRLLRELRAVVS